MRSEKRGHARGGKPRLAILMATFALASAVTGTPCADAASSFRARSVVEGRWVFFRMIYQGQERPPLNPDLLILLELRPDGTDRLFWTRQGQEGFCERLAHYTDEAPFLSEEIYWANPRNARECARDPDMTPGRKGSTRVEIHPGTGSPGGEVLYMHLGLGDETLIYVWRRCEAAAGSGEVAVPGDALCQK